MVKINDSRQMHYQLVSDKNVHVKHIHRNKIMNNDFMDFFEIKAGRVFAFYECFLNYLKG